MPEIELPCRIKDEDPLESEEKELGTCDTILFKISKVRTAKGFEAPKLIKFLF